MSGQCKSGGHVPCLPLDGVLAPWETMPAGRYSGVLPRLPPEASIEPGTCNDKMICVAQLLDNYVEIPRTTLRFIDPLQTFCRLHAALSKALCC